MEFLQGLLHVGPFRAVTWGIVVLFIGRALVHKSRFLKDYNIPEPVVGGLLCSVALGVLHVAFGVTVEFDLDVPRDIMLVYFFTTIGLNARLGDLVAGGRPLAILLAATVGYMVLQNLTGISVAALFGLPPQAGLLGGTVSLIGGHGTAIAWAPQFAARYGIPNAMEIGVACATFGLVLASTMGGPIAKHLIGRHNLEPETTEGLDVGVGFDQDASPIEYYGLLRAILVIHVSVTLGAVANFGLEGLGLRLPLFVTCLLVAIVLANTVPRLFPRMSWPSRTAALALIADVALGVFLSMSLMSMQLWTLVDLAGPLLAILGAQFVIAVSVTVFVIFPIMGRTYDAAVVCSGFGGISLGSTATAMANMTAVTHRYGPSHLAFIIVPLVCAFFIDIVNAFLIQFLLQTL